MAKKFDIFQIQGEYGCSPVTLEEIKSFLHSLTDLKSYEDLVEFTIGISCGINNNEMEVIQRILQLARDYTDNLEVKKELSQEYKKSCAKIKENEHYIDSMLKRLDPASKQTAHTWKKRTLSLQQFMSEKQVDPTLRVYKGPDPNDIKPIPIVINGKVEEYLPKTK